MPNTYDCILNRMLSKIPKGLDIREGSIIYDALAPAAAELAQSYIEIDNIMNETFADTASFDFLARRALERGIKPYESTKAIFRADFNMNIPLLSRFSLEDFNFLAIEKIDEHIYKLECESYGEKVNNSTGSLIPIAYIEGLTKAVLTELLIPGEDEEGTEGLRARYYASLSSQSFGGNITDYIEKTESIPGVGGCKIYPVWNGGGTVKIVVLSSQYKKPSTELIDKIQTLIDPTQSKGEGIGLAPIGHTVTVEGVAEHIINIHTNITCLKGYSFEDLENSIKDIINIYFLGLAKDWAETAEIIVRISQIETRILNIHGVLDIKDTRLNGVVSNIVLDKNFIPILGEISND